MTMFKLTLSTSNAAFGEKEWESADETAAILEACASYLRAGHTEGTLRDHNGNKVGEYSLTSED